MYSIGSSRLDVCDRVGERDPRGGSAAVADRILVHVGNHGVDVDSEGQGVVTGHTDDREAKQFATVIEKGFGDLNQALMNVFVYPGPDRARPNCCRRPVGRAGS